MYLNKNLGLSLFSVLVTCLLLEFCFRLFDVRYSDISSTKYINVSQCLQTSPHPFYPGYNGHQISYYSYKYKPNSTWATQYPNNERGYFDANNQIEYKMNSDGFRDYEFEAKNTNTFRILVIGDSYAFGEGVKLEDSFAKVLEVKLREKNSNIEVYNLGVNGFDIRDEIAVLQNNLELFKPDMVIWGYVLNDISHPAFDLWPAEMKKIKRTFYLKSSSYLLNYIQERVWNSYYSEQYIRFVLGKYNNPVDWNEVTVLFREALTRIQDAKASMVVLVFPDLNALSRNQYAFEPIHNKLRDLFKAENLHFIDFSNVFKLYGPLNLRVHSIDAHPNEIGHRIIAEKIFQDSTIFSELWSAKADLPLGN